MPEEYQYHNDSADHTQGYLVPPLLRLLNPSKNKCILDIGCGNGWLTQILIREGYNAFGTDISTSGIAIAKKGYPDRFFLQDITSKELPPEIREIPFDTVISTEVIEHLYSPAQFLQFCRIVLQKNGGGEFLLSTPYHGYLKNLLLAIIGKMDSHFTANWEGGHIKFFSQKTIRQALESAGFEMTHFVGCGRLPYFWKSMLVKASLK